MRSGLRVARPRWLVSIGVVLFLALVATIGWWFVSPRGPRFLEQWPEVAGDITQWHGRAPGIAYARGRLDQPRPVKWHALRIDLHDPGIEVVVGAYPEAVDVFVSAWPSSLLRSEGLLAAINATPFEPEPYLPGALVRPQGLIAIGGGVLAGAVSNLDALVESGHGTWSFCRGQAVSPVLRSAAGGFLVDLIDSSNRGEDRPVDAVTAVGLSADRRWMYWLVVDGGQPGYSEGASPREAADLLMKLGASDGLRFDGGSSTTLVLAEGWTGARVMNRPRSPLVSGFQRPVASVLGVRRREGATVVGQGERP
jgi:hypothetical protein